MELILTHNAFRLGLGKIGILPIYLQGHLQDVSFSLGNKYIIVVGSKSYNTIIVYIYNSIQPKLTYLHCRVPGILQTTVRAI